MPCVRNGEDEMPLSAIFSAKPTFSSTTTEGASSLADGGKLPKAARSLISHWPPQNLWGLVRPWFISPCPHAHSHSTAQHNYLSQPTSHPYKPPFHHPTSMTTFDYTGFKLGEKKVLKENEVTHAPAEVPHLFLALLPPPHASTTHHFVRAYV